MTEGPHATPPVLPEVRSALNGGQAFNFGIALDRAVERYPERVAVVDGNRRVTYEELLARANAVAASLDESGIKPGERVGVLLTNRVEFIEIFFGVLRQGSVFVPINFRLSGPEIDYIVEHAGIQVLFAEPELAERLGADTTLSRRVVPTPGAEYQRLAGRAASRPCWPAAASDLQRIMYTSGTTGHPKGVMIHHEAVLWKCLNQMVEFGLRGDDVFLASGPLYHVGTLDLPGIGLFLLGGRIVILPRFDPVQVLETVHAEGITCTFLAPSMMNRLLAEPTFEHYDVSSLRIIIDGSEKMPMNLLERIPSAFPHAMFYDGFGMTETVTGDSFLWPGHLERKLGSVGRPTLTMETRVVDDEDRDVAPGQPGELVVRGPKLFCGYWRDEEATATAFRGGWFHTGDMATVDEEGYITIVDRKKDMIKSGGENVASVEVERVLYASPDVLEAAVVGRPDPDWIEVPVAFVVPRQERTIDTKALADYCRKQLAGFKVPKAFFVVEELPRNPSGKVLKRELRQRLTPDGNVDGGNGGGK